MPFYEEIMIYTDFIDNNRLVAFLVVNMKKAKCLKVLTNHLINNCIYWRILLGVSGPTLGLL